MLVRVLLESNPNFSWFANQFFDQLNLRAFKLKLLKEMAAVVTYLTFQQRSISSPEPPGGPRTRRRPGGSGDTGFEVLIFSTSGHFRFKTKLEDSLLKASESPKFTVIDASARANERY